jgi:hypothetical protein
MPEYTKSIQLKVISEIDQIVGPRLERATSVIGAPAVAWAIRRDETCASRDCISSMIVERVADPRRTMEDHDGSSVRTPELDPGEVTTVRKLDDTTLNRHQRSSIESQKST